MTVSEALRLAASILTILAYITQLARDIADLERGQGRGDRK